MVFKKPNVSNDWCETIPDDLYFITKNFFCKTFFSNDKNLPKNDIYLNNFYFLLILKCINSLTTNYFFLCIKTYNTSIISFFINCNIKNLSSNSNDRFIFKLFSLYSIISVIGIDATALRSSPAFLPSKNS